MKKQIIFATLFTGGVFCALFGGFMGFGVPYSYGLELEFWRMLFSVGLGAAVLGGAGLIK
jgi:hypothetical protein